MDVVLLYSEVVPIVQPPIVAPKARRSVTLIASASIVPVMMLSLIHICPGLFSCKSVPVYFR